jgi:hypothetical protein
MRQAILDFDLIRKQAVEDLKAGRSLLRRGGSFNSLN